MKHSIQTCLPARFNGNLLEAGCDEAGRGPLAGPVFAAAVILPEDFRHPLLNDSKQMSKKDRQRLREIILREAEAYAVEAVTAEEIDSINILNASIAGMWRAVMSLPKRPDTIAVDGNRFKAYGRIPRPENLSAVSAGISRQERISDPAETDTKGPLPWESPDIIEDRGTIPYVCIVKGDAKYADIAAASVLAKTSRDEYMKALASSFPEYGWDRNMGYPTREHIEAIRKYGLTPHHRKSFHVRELEPVLFQ